MLATRRDLYDEPTNGLEPAASRRFAPLLLEPVITGGMLGYGPFHYRYGSGREGDACKLSITSNASYISLYCFAADGKGYIAERYVDRLPKASIGKACVRFRKLADSTPRRSWRSSRRPRRWASSPELARRRCGGRPRAGGQVAATRQRSWQSSSIPRSPPDTWAQLFGGTLIFDQFGRASITEALAGGRTHVR